MRHNAIRVCSFIYLSIEKAYKLGELYLNGDGVEKNEQTAFDYFKIAADQGHVNAQYKLGFIYDNGLGLDQDYVTAIAWYKKAASQNHITANYRLGRMHFLGEGVEQDNDLVFEYFKVAAELGDAESQYELGLCYKMGYGVDESYDQVIPWHLKAADQGSNTSYVLRDIGLFYEHGDVFEQDYGKALDYYLQSADHKNIGAYLNIAQLYYFGLGVEQDLRTCLEWLSKIESEKPSDMCTHVYIQYGREAFSRPSNLSKDRIYSVISEDALFGKAHHLLGLLYTQGEGGIDKDHKKAVKHFKIAFEKGVEEAQVYIHEANRIDIQSLSLAETVTKNDEPIK
ncbi:HCP-like protein [Backusella circina FSU 941]|nr:HCP-like protein [Backusella circina FSU 941]